MNNNLDIQNTIYSIVNKNKSLNEFITTGSGEGLGDSSDRPRYTGYRSERRVPPPGQGRAGGEGSGGGVRVPPSPPSGGGGEGVPPSGGSTPSPVPGEPAKSKGMIPTAKGAGKAALEFGIPFYAGMQAYDAAYSPVTNLTGSSTAGHLVASSAFGAVADPVHDIITKKPESGSLLSPANLMKQSPRELLKSAGRGSVSGLGFGVGSLAGSGIANAAGIENPYARFGLELATGMPAANLANTLTTASGRQAAIDVVTGATPRMRNLGSLVRGTVNPLSLAGGAVGVVGSVAGDLAARGINYGIDKATGMGIKDDDGRYPGLSDQDASIFEPFKLASDIVNFDATERAELDAKRRAASPEGQRRKQEMADVLKTGAEYDRGQRERRSGLLDTLFEPKTGKIKPSDVTVTSENFKPRNLDNVNRLFLIQESLKYFIKN